jgi:tRNA(Phe) wybutosine-synthesizing methylase Tyw3
MGHGLCVGVGDGRNSGLVLGKKIMVGVRMTLKLEAPIAMDGAALVDAHYMRTVVALANGMFQENMERIARFEQQFHDALVLDQQRRADAVAKTAAKQAVKEVGRRSPWPLL